jgi:YYY domain-containing protein
VPALFALVLLSGAALRFTGLDWDSGAHLHPDERFLTMVVAAQEWSDDLLGTYFDEQNSKLNPRNVGHTFYVYGGLPVILIKWLSITVNRPGYDGVHLVGRTVCALVDLGTVTLLFLLARQLYHDIRIALLAAALYAGAALAIQHSHFFVVDNFGTFFATAALLFISRVQQRGRLLDYVFAGVCIGLGLASKISVYPLAGLLALAAGARLLLAWRQPGTDRSLAFERAAVRLTLGGLAAFLAFRVGDPYAFLGPGFFGISPSPRWLANITEARDWVNGVRDAPFAYQWVDRTALLFPLQNMLLWGLGLPLGLAAWTGLAVAAWRLAAGRGWAHLIPVTWALVLFVTQGTQLSKSMRYFLPIYPTLALFAGWLMIGALDRARGLADGSVGGLLGPLRAARAALALGAARALLLLVVVGTALYAIAFTTIYTRTHTRIEASRWIYANVPPRAAIANETVWDDALPLRIDGKDAFANKTYTDLNVDITDEDTPAKLRKMLGVLDRTEYLFISSNRQHDSLTRMPIRFPLVVRYYRALFNGQLGFERIADFSSYPSLFGLQLPDQSAEEAWSVYDHPRVQIFRKTADYSHAQAEALLSDVDWNAIVTLSTRDASRTPTALLLRPADQELYQASGTWSELFNPDSLANRVPLIVWILALLTIGLVGLPYLWLAAGSLPDRGFAFARPLGLLLVGWLAWCLASLRLLPFTRSSLVLVLGLVALGAVGIGLRRRALFSAWLRQRWPLLLLEESLFWLGFIVFVAIRWANPDLWHPVLGGEKPMDFAYLNAVVRSIYFPPYDPWFADGYLNYYYFGFVLSAVLVKLTSIVPAVAYNLLVPTFFATLLLGAFGVTLAFLDRPGVARPGRRALLFALLGAVFVAVVGNLRQLTLLFEGFRSLSSMGLRTGVPALDSLARVIDGFANGFLAGKPLPFRIEWWYWNATRVIQHPASEAGPITELPWFSYLFADLHAHLMALPYTVLVLGLALAWLRQAPERRSWLARALHLLLLALSLGALWPLNTWDYPTYALLVLVAFLLRASLPLSRSRLVRATGTWIALLVLGYFLFLPFHRAYGAAESGIELWKGSKTGLGDYLTIHGFFLFCIVMALLVDFRGARGLNPVGRLVRVWARWWYRGGHLRLLLRRIVRPSPVVRAGVWAVGSLWLIALGLWVLGKHVPGLVLALMVLTALLFFRRPSQDGRTALWQMALVLIFSGLGLTLAVELVVLKNVDISRMNTVFKFYLQVWVLWGIAAAVGAASVAQHARRFPLVWRTAWRTAFGLLFGAVLLYPLTATGPRIADRFEGSTERTLDGSAFMERAVLREKDQQIPLKDDLEAIRWMEQHLPGAPVIAEVNTHPNLYGWGDRFAVYTGNPVVIGWDWHQRQQRAAVPSTMISKRLEDLQKAYSTTDPRQAYDIFAKYGVQYFVVGRLERAYYPAGQAKWERQSESRWEVVYQNPGVAIYRVLPAAVTG